MDVLAFHDVTKRFGAHEALRGVSFDVRPGEIFGLLGPNGAGKTTSIRIAVDILRPDSGEVRLFGAKLARDALDRVSYLPEERGLYRKSRVDDVLVYLGELKGLSRDDAEERTERWLERLGLVDAADARVESLSKGNQQKVQIAGALLHDPELAILDEPFSGLDPLNVELVLGLLAERKERGLTTVLSTHVMEKVETLCDRVVLIYRGERLLYGTVDEVRGLGDARRSMDAVFVDAVRAWEDR